MSTGRGARSADVGDRDDVDEEQEEEVLFICSNKKEQNAHSSF
jgi:hypothetical protein